MKTFRMSPKSLFIVSLLSSVLYYNPIIAQQAIYATSGASTYFYLWNNSNSALSLGPNPFGNDPLFTPSAKFHIKIPQFIIDGHAALKTEVVTPITNQIVGTVENCVYYNSNFYGIYQTCPGI